MNSNSPQLHQSGKRFVASTAPAKSDRYGLPVWSWVLVVGTILATMAWLWIASRKNPTDSPIVSLANPATLPRSTVVASMMAAQPTSPQVADRASVGVVQVKPPRQVPEAFAQTNPVPGQSTNSQTIQNLRTDDPPTTVTLSDGTKFELEQWGETYQAYEFLPPIETDQAKVIMDWGDGPQFRQIAVDGARGKIYWLAGADVGVLGCINADGTNKQILRRKIRGPHGLALDLKHDKVYWAGSDPEINRGYTIRRANLDGTSEEDLVKGLTGVWQLSLDVEGDAMYYFDQLRIKRAKLDGTNEESLPIDPVKYEQGIPRLVALHRGRQRIFWGNWGTSKGISCANLDGTDRRTDLTLNLHTIWSLAVDEINDQFYWMDKFGVARANLDGTNGHRITTDFETTAPTFCIDFTNARLYWVGDNQTKLLLADLPPLPQAKATPAPPVIEAIVPLAATEKEEITLSGSGFRGTTMVAFIDDANGNNVQAEFHVESDHRVKVVVPRLSEQTERAAIVLIAAAGLTVTLPVEVTAVTNQYAFERSSLNRWKPFVVRDGGILWSAEGRSVYVQARGTATIGPRSGTTMFLKNGTHGYIDQGPKNVVYHEPFAHVLRRGDGISSVFVAVPAIRASFVPVLPTYGKLKAD